MFGGAKHQFSVLVLILCCCSCCSTPTTKKQQPPANLNELLDQITASFPFPMLSLISAGGGDVVYCTASFRMKRGRWPTDYEELKSYVQHSDGYLLLAEHQNVQMATNDNGGLQLTFKSANTTITHTITLPAPSPNH
jgi:hypothetical protein